MELVVASASSVLLLGGLSSSLYIASQGFEENSAPLNQATANSILNDILADLKHAISFSEHTANAVTFTVPDRTGDGISETIRYAWSGTTGDPLTFEYNGSSAVTLADNVENFDLTYLTRLTTAPIPPPPDGKDQLLFVVTNIFFPNSSERARQDLFESWGYTVNRIDDDDSQENYTVAFEENDVIYVSEKVSSTSLGTKLNNATIGVVSEEAELTDELGFSSSAASATASIIEITDNTHYITSEFAVGSISLSSSDQEMTVLSGTLAPGLEILGQWGFTYGLGVLESGATTHDGGTAAGRRVALPWGGSTFDIGLLTDDGRTMLRLAIEWAAASEELTPSQVLFVSGQAPDGDGGIGSPTAAEQDRIDMIETWGYVTTLINHSASQDEFDTALASADVVYVSGQVNPFTVGSKVTSTTVGVVTESFYHADELGFYSSGTPQSMSSTTIGIINPSHYITSGFSIGNLTVASTSQEMKWTFTQPADGASTLADVDEGLNLPSMLVLEAGATLAEGGSASGRRVQLPWGESAFDVNALNTDGQTIMQRAIEWAASDSSEALGAVGHWMLDETSGTTAADSSGNGHDGTHENGTILGESAVIGAGARFDGTNDRVRIPDDPAFSSHASTGLTAAAWIRVHNFDTDGNGQARQPIVSKGYLSEFEWALMVYDDGRAEFTTWQADGSAHSAAVGGSIQLEQWVHVAGTHEPGVATRVYVNGVEVNSDTTFVGSTHDGTRDLFIATLESFQYLNATIDDVRVYDRALTAEEIATLVNSSGLVAHWKLDETNGATAVDSVGGLDGTLINGPLWTTGQLDGALDFDGTNDYIEVPHSSDLNLQSAFTVTAWIYNDSMSDAYRVISKETNGLNDNYWIALQAGELWAGVGGSFFNAPATFEANTWYHIAVSFDDADNQVSIYVNGELSQEYSTSATISSNTDPLYIGSNWQGSKFWDGALDDVRIYDRALSASQVAAIALEGGGSGVVYEEFTEAKVSSATTSVSVNTPSGTTEGDLLIAAIALDGDPLPIVAPDGWNEIIVEANGSRETIAIWWKLASASEPSSHTFTWDFNDNAYAWIMRFTGHDPNSPIHALGVYADQLQNPVSPAVTTSIDDCLILRVGAFDQEDITIDDTGLSTATTITMDSSGAGTFASSGGAGYSYLETAGDSGIDTFTLIDSEEHVTVTIAIAPE